MERARQILLESQRELEERGLNCQACTGECCTAKSNSMQITRSEAETIQTYLLQTSQWDEQLFARLKSCVREYRLDVELPRFGSRPNLRRTYTCPFYSPGPQGCDLPRSVKPMGCLAFNPTKRGATGLKDHCQSDQNLLAKISLAETAEKYPIPLALMKLNSARADSSP